jgi:hypothetical protein
MVRGYFNYGIGPVGSRAMHFVIEAIEEPL